MGFFSGGGPAGAAKAMAVAYAMQTPIAQSASGSVSKEVFNDFFGINDKGVNDFLGGVAVGYGIGKAWDWGVDALSPRSEPIDPGSNPSDAKGETLQDGHSRSLTTDEIELAKSVFGDSIDYDLVRIYKDKYFMFQPKNVAMAPDGNIYFHPDGGLYVSNFGQASLEMQGLFIHEMTHIWQHQSGVNVALRGVFNRNYSYSLSAGQSFSSYGIEQQGNIVRDYFFLQRDSAGGPTIERYNRILPF